MTSAIKLQLVVATAFLSAASFSSATEWTGTLSCGEAQNQPNANARTKSPFVAPVTLRIEGKKAALDRNWATGSEHLEGTVSRGQPLQLEGIGRLFNNETNTWKTRATLTESGRRFQGTATIGTRDGRTKTRDCTVSVEVAEAAAVRTNRADERSKAEKETTEKAAKKAAADRAMAERAAADQRALEKAAADKAAVEKANVKAAADKAAAEKAVTDRAAEIAATKAALDRATAEKEASEKAVQKAAADRAVAEKAAADQRALEKAAVDKAAAENAKKQPIRVQNAMDL